MLERSQSVFNQPSSRRSVGTINNLRPYRVFEAIARLGSFNEAAHALFLSPAAVSLAVRQLEENAGVRLFERTTRKVTLTGAGDLLLPRIQALLSAASGAEACVRYLGSADPDRTVRIATTPAITSSLLGVLFERAAEPWLDARINCVEIPSSGLGSAVALGSADIVIGVRLAKDDYTDSQPFFVSRWGALIPSGHPLAARTRLQWDELSGQQLVLVNESTRHVLGNALGDTLDLSSAHCVNTTMEAIAIAAGGHAIVVAPHYVTPLGGIRGLRGAAIDAPVVPHVLDIATARNPSPHSQVTKVRDFLLREVPKTYASFQ
jgi:DNA-binding transcriptional LysR family regulator